jgi:hypothetical protein
MTLNLIVEKMRINQLQFLPQGGGTVPRYVLQLLLSEKS